MKRLIIFICLIIVICLGYSWVNNGFENDKINIASYETIETKSEALTKKLANYDKKNQDEYERAITTLNSSIKMYKDSKSKYEAIYEELADLLKKPDDDENEDEVLEEVIYSDKEKYNVDFLFVTLGGYARKEGVDVTYRLTTSSTTDPNSSTLKYFLADLEFTVTGQYMDIANFVSDLENDDKLGWEIRKFEMTQGNAKFVIKDVPIDSESYIESSGVVSTGNQDDPNSDANQSTQNTTNTTNTTTSAPDTNSTVNNTTTNNSSMTNTVSNNTVN